MRAMARYVCSGALALLILTPNTSFANTDIAGIFDARSTAMASTGAAFIDSAAAIPINPAMLEAVDTLTVTLNATYLRAQQQAPYSIWHTDANGQQYKTYDTIRADPQNAVLPFVGGAYRLHERWVIGLAAYPMIGQGVSTKYMPAPVDMPTLVANSQAAIGLVEAALPVSVRLLDNLSFALMWRVTYLTQDVSTPVPNAEYPGVLVDRATSSAVNANLKLSGIDFAGLQLGLRYQPIPRVTIGFTYRNKVSVNGTGTATTKLGSSDTVLDARQSYTAPHTFRAGVAWQVADFLFAADFKYLLYAEAYKIIKTVTVFPGGPEMTAEQPVYWKNALSFSIGAEYRLSDPLRLRAGYALITSATSAKYAVALMSPPAPSSFFSVGVGFKPLERLSVDVAAAYIVLSTYVENATQYNAGTGTYGVNSLEASLSATYRM